jgi:hypothetical protein
MLFRIMLYLDREVLQDIRWQHQVARLPINERASGFRRPRSVAGLRDVAALHARPYLARNFLMMGEKNDPRGFLVSPRPVSRCAICRNILAVR